MDDIERLYRHLVRTVRASYAPFLTEPFEVSELYQTILPYRLHRRELGFETNQDYEMAMLELLSGARGFLIVDDKMRDVLAAEQSARNPDPSVLRDFASAHVALAPEALRQLDQEGRGSPSSPAIPTSKPPLARPSGGMESLGVSQLPRVSLPTPAAGLPSDGNSSRRTARPIKIATEGETCLFCRGDLPTGRGVSFCPHCGQDLTMVHCPACGGELERGWKFCVTCGRSSVDL